MSEAHTGAGEGVEWEAGGGLHAVFWVELLRNAEDGGSISAKIRNLKKRKYQPLMRKRGVKREQR